MGVMMLRAKVKPESTADLEAGARAMFAALEREQPAGVSYASYRMADGVTYVVVLEIQDGIENPLPTVAAFREFQQNLRGWVAEPPAPEQLVKVGEYRS